VQYYKVFQHASTVLGAAVLAIWFAQWYRVAVPVHSRIGERYQKYGRTMLICLLAIAICVAAIRVFVGTGSPAEIRKPESLLAEGVITTITAFWLEVVVYGIIRNWQTSHKQLV